MKIRIGYCNKNVKNVETNTNLNLNETKKWNVIGIGHPYGNIALS